MSVLSKSEREYKNRQKGENVNVFKSIWKLIKQLKKK